MTAHTPELIEQLADLVQAGSEKQLVDLSLQVTMTLCCASRGAVFAIGDGLTLATSRSIHHGVLSFCNAVWADDARRAELEAGRIVAWPAAGLEHLSTFVEGAGSVAVVGLHHDDLMVGLLYLDAPDVHLADRQRLDRPAQAARIVAAALARSGLFVDADGTLPTPWGDFLEQSTPEQVARQHLVTLLDRNEWNIARVARLMGVTRRTIYLRLERYNIERKRIPKTPGRPEPEEA